MNNALLLFVIISIAISARNQLHSQLGNMCTTVPYSSAFEICTLLTLFSVEYDCTDCSNSILWDIAADCATHESGFEIYNCVSEAIGGNDDPCYPCICYVIEEIMGNVSFCT